MRDLAQRSRDLLDGSRATDYQDERARLRTYEAYTMVGNLQLFFTPILSTVVILTCGPSAATPAIGFLLLLVLCRVAGVLFMTSERVPFVSNLRTRPLRTVLLTASLISVPIALHDKYPHKLPTDNHLSLLLSVMEYLAIVGLVFIGISSIRKFKK